jgi:hypothetical protein
MLAGFSSTGWLLGSSSPYTSLAAKAEETLAPHRGNVEHKMGITLGLAATG